MKRRAPGVASLGILAVLVWQSIEVSQSYNRVLAFPLWLTPVVAWASLFALLGIVATGALGRSIDRKSALLLGIRALTPIWLAVIAALLVLGPLMTLAGAGPYFSDPETWSYLLNLVAWPQLSLPSVFEFNNFAEVVNLAVVTLPPALLTVAGASLIRRLGPRAAYGAIVLASAALAAIAVDWVEGEATSLAILAAASGQAGLVLARWGPGKLTITRLVAGCVFLAVLALAGAIRPGLQPFFTAAAVPSAAWLTAFLLMSPLAFLREIARFVRWPALVFGFPIQQTVSTAAWGAKALGNMLFSLPLILLAAWATDFYLERLSPPPPEAEQTAVQPMTGGKASRVGRRPSAGTSGELMAVALIFSIVLVALLAVTLFALQRNPWEN